MRVEAKGTSDYMFVMRITKRRFCAVTGEVVTQKRYFVIGYNRYRSNSISVVQYFILNGLC